MQVFFSVNKKYELMNTFRKAIVVSITIFEDNQGWLSNSFVRKRACSNSISFEEATEKELRLICLIIYLIIYMRI